jgi:hypothetical protein
VPDLGNRAGLDEDEYEIVVRKEKQADVVVDPTRSMLSSDTVAPSQ